jgi:hypothetical protein
MVGYDCSICLNILLISIIEQRDFPLQMVVSAKGKEKEPPSVRVGLKWVGRQTLVQRAGLPTSPPGKLFRSDYSGIPMSSEDREALREYRL